MIDAENARRRMLEFLAYGLCSESAGLHTLRELNRILGGELFGNQLPSIYPKMAFTGRVPNDPTGTMEGIATLFSGAASQTGGLTT